MRASDRDEAVQRRADEVRDIRRDRGPGIADGPRLHINAADMADQDLAGDWKTRGKHNAGRERSNARGDRADHGKTRVFGKGARGDDQRGAAAGRRMMMASSCVSISTRSPSCSRAAFTTSPGNRTARFFPHFPITACAILRSPDHLGISPEYPVRRLCPARQRVRLAAGARRPHDAGMEIRDAIIADAPAACAVLRRSIIALCAADHGDDPAVLRRWLANKTPEIVASWIAKPGNSVLIAVEGAAILAVGAVTDGGEITLNYVAPEARFRGVSRALLAALETRARERGNTRCTLHSTETARRFYHALGYCEDGPPDGKFGAKGGCPMSKTVR